MITLIVKNKLIKSHKGKCNLYNANIFVEIQRGNEIYN